MDMQLRRSSGDAQVYSMSSVIMTGSKRSAAQRRMAALRRLPSHIYSAPAAVGSGN